MIQNSCLDTLHVHMKLQYYGFLQNVQSSNLFTGSEKDSF